MAGIHVNTALEFISRPTKSDLRRILAWLKKEYEEQGEGFYCNRDIVEAGFEDHHLVCGRLGGQPVTFLVWSGGQRVVEVSIMVTRPEQRGGGIGSTLVRSAFSYLRNTKGILALHLECTPSTSEPFWRKHEFINFPSVCMSYRSGVELYRTLPEDAPSIAGLRAVLEIWHKPIYEVGEGEPADATRLLPLTGTKKFIRKVAILALPDWKARLTFPDTDSIEGKVKHLFSRSCLEGGFLVGIPALAS